VKIIKFLLALFFITIIFQKSELPVLAKEETQIYFFYGQGCPHCSHVEKFFEEESLYQQYPIKKLEIYSNHENAIFYNQLLDKLEIPNESRGVPTLVIENKVFVGDKSIIANFVSEADGFLQRAGEQPESKLPKETHKQGFDLTIAIVIGASIVDAINPCAFAVLIILMTTILASGDGGKALKAGVAFSASIFISYFLMGLGLYKALGIGNLSGLFFKTIGWLALILGLLNLKDYFWYGKGLLMEVPMSWRPKLKSLIKSATSTQGAFSIGFLISLFLLPCTSGPYIVILGMLAENTTQLKAILYLALYNFIFVLPMILISIAVYKGFNPNKAEDLRQKQLKNLHLIAGVIMIAMGVVVLKRWV
jgi:cytochrome c biogenesis protein CcdA/glutaredoxin